MKSIGFNVLKQEKHQELFKANKDPREAKNQKDKKGDIERKKVMLW